jgi:cytochrome P450
MVLYPEAQRRGQEELDSVLGHGHLPSFEDAGALPYLKAMLHELLRWACPTPLGQRDSFHCTSKFTHKRSTVLLGAPHRATEDNIYNGYFIPAGTLVFANIWYAQMSSKKKEALSQRASDN